MFHSSKAASAYKSMSLESRVASSNNQELVVMLLEGCLERIGLAQRSIEAGDIAGRVRYVSSAIQILSEGLRTHLDMRRGGEVARNLDTLYNYCILRLMEANLHADARALAEVGRLLDPICQAWRQMGRGGSDENDAARLARAADRAAQDALGDDDSGVKRMMMMRPQGGLYGMPVFAGV